MSCEQKSRKCLASFPFHNLRMLLVRRQVRTGLKTCRVFLAHLAASKHNPNVNTKDLTHPTQDGSAES